MPTQIGLISLGCAKNLIDSEIMLGHLQDEGMTLVPDPELADALIINTCSFIDVAKDESVGTIIEAVNARQEDPAREKQKIIVAGCLSQRFQKDLPGLLPEVDAFIGLDQVTEVASIVRKTLNRDLEEDGSLDTVTEKSRYIPDYTTPRFRLTPQHMAYIKIAEGCNHTCAFCIIPKIRGQHRSRTEESIVREAKGLIAQGVKEINLISQDTTYFGMDKWQGLGNRPKPTSGVDSTRGESLSTLLRALDGLEGDFWIRLLYTHPAHWSDELIQTIAECPKIARYVDIPLQHISNHMLDKMNRKTDGKYIRDLLKRMRDGIPDLSIRTTFITGFPEETDEDHQELLEFIKDFKFERCGIFQYSKEEGTRAHKMEGHVHHATKKKRHRELSSAIDEVAGEINEAQLGKKKRVLVEEEGIARSMWDAPDIDGRIFVPIDSRVGEFLEVEIKDHRGYDLVAK
ncbi:30S ribosomal protein S12 methylthiotransferase RimO [Akkermansiaceae bacterium]|jgi:ribosomal protein S12 methylthiotransferase|nr:30S ribosomal protein S12 methylthiotransferase RimO [Verrucomicrobiota bacterium]MDA7499042.1 30S ribosomal protein S12 methylthiotransferase RimO [Akkermansiaceae bacterium]MDB4410745.1 30S ribosomal protein S12 methylthiotransferase RimO [bacterium]MDA7655400.1 30S ribosomal protein S12 methylthiotransferase RimO [Akkermansiaceae bacterium]MDA7664806.1 30S ribosomal protein S12 methylthiotransferase RimO [Akkermansiaceae bacterium]